MRDRDRCRTRRQSTWQSTCVLAWSIERRSTESATVEAFAVPPPFKLPPSTCSLQYDCRASARPDALIAMHSNIGGCPDPDEDNKLMIPAVARRRWPLRDYRGEGCTDMRTHRASKLSVASLRVVCPPPRRGGATVGSQFDLEYGVGRGPRKLAQSQQGQYVALPAFSA